MLKPIVLVFANKHNENYVGSFTDFESTLKTWLPDSK